MAFSFKGVPTFIESSTNPELNDLASFLARVAPLIDSGFSGDEVAALVLLASSLSVDEEKERTFQIVHEGRKCPLRVRFFIDDIDEVTIYIFSPPPLAEKINSLMELYAGF